MATYLYNITPELICIFLGILVCNCQNEPDITFLSRINNNEYKYLCVIGNNLTNHAVEIITPLSTSYLLPVSEYRTPEGTPVSEDINNCDFENECSKIFDNNDWKTVQSANHLLPIIHDIRFEKLYTHKLREGQLSYEISEQDFYFPISVRAEEPHILLCNEGNKNISQCYWISIEKRKKYYFEVVIRKCNKVNKLNSTLNDSDCLLLTSTEHKTNLVRELDWFHYILLRNKNTIIFKDAVTNEEYINQEDVKYDIKKMYVKTSNGKKGEWKIHKNSYLKLKTSNSEIQLGPTFLSNNDDNFCISMLVSICQGCSLEIRINNQTRERFIGNSDNWQNIKLTSVSTQTKEFKIFVKASRNNVADIIAIDNIRLCHKNEIRILRITSIYKLPSISCKVLSYPTWYSTLNYTSRSSNDLCSDAKYIGKNCDIPCSAVLDQGSDTEFCNKHFICKPTENYYEQNCICAAGYRGHNCDEICEPNYFGYNCGERCGRCKSNDSCLKSSGICNDGCESDYFPDMCKFKLYEPVNLSGTVDENGQIQLNWQQPKSNQFVSIYKIIISLENSILQKSFTTIIEDANFSDKQQSYLYKLKKSVFLSSTYSVQVCGQGEMTHCANIMLITPPVKPLLTQSFITIENNNNHSKIIKIPGIVPNIISYMYVTVCDEYGNGTEIKFPNDTKILSQIVCLQRSWIALKNKVNESEVTLIVGEGKKSANVYDNPPLKANNKYNICVVLTNEYENEIAYSVYCGNNNKSSLVWIIVGILVASIVIIVVVLIVVKKKGRLTRNISDSIPMNCDSATDAPMLPESNGTTK